MSYNLCNYSVSDLNGDGLAEEPKPEASRDAIAHIITAEAPDILLLQEMGRKNMLNDLQQRLSIQGNAYAYQELLHRGRHQINLAVLSKIPLESVTRHTNDTYRIGEATLHMSRGMLELEIKPQHAPPVTVLNVHLKSKIYHQLGQTEMRRNEARILHQLIRKRLKEQPDRLLLVAGDLNDHCKSSVFRTILAENSKYPLADLRPQDQMGNAWTHQNSDIDSYNRIDYFLASTNLLPRVMNSYTSTHQELLTASDHRPLIVTLRVD